MDYKVFAPSLVETEVALPASKSISNRLLMLNALCAGTAPAIANIARCDDTDAMATAIAATGEHIDVGAAGTAMRFLTAYFATREGRTVLLDGSARMRQRPIGALVDTLRRCGASIAYAGTEGFPPLQITGRRLGASSLEMPGDISSQYISAMLMIAPVIGCRSVTLTGHVISRPYISLTLSLMRLMGVESTFNGNVITIDSCKGYKPCNLSVESDWTAASYWMELQALLPKSRIALLGLEEASPQGDSAAARLMEPLGVRTRFSGNGRLELSVGSVPSTPIVMDLSSNPDLAQTIAVTACLTGRHFHIGGLQTLKIKETDRIEALRSQLRTLGYMVDATPDMALEWHGERCEPQERPRIATFKDHRMAMAFAPAAVKFPGLVIEDVDVVAKSYPDYWTHLRQAGFTLVADSKMEEDTI